ncbi:MAG: hypothetical protein BMS9Abin13_310 [Patescibacteria group bacterium]|nr:MAG: hypothetical protein BMS9Abin13_310 [Patescibacteria group bacterium]
MKKTKVVLISASVVLAILYAFWSYGPGGGLDKEFGKLGIAMAEAGDFQLKERNSEDIIRAERGEEILKIKILKNYTKEEADEYIRGKMLLFNGLFEQQLPPYPEFLTRQTGCDQKYKPVEIETRYGTYHVTYAGARFGYGICADDLIEYRASLGFFYCPARNTLFKVEYFIPKDKDPARLSTLNDSFLCLE